MSESLKKNLVDTLKAWCSKVDVSPFLKDAEDVYVVGILKKKDSIADLCTFLCEQDYKDVNIHREAVSFTQENKHITVLFETAETFESTLFYHSYSGLNYLVSKVFQLFGIIFNEQGLIYTLKSEYNMEYRDVILTRFPKQIYSFLNYDFSRWEKGFDTKEDLFSFVVSTPYFNSFFFDDYISLEKELLTWVKKNPKTNYPLKEDKSLYLYKIHNHFIRVNLFGEMMRYALEIDKKEQRFKKFNAELIKQWTELDNKELGKIIRDFKQYAINTLYPYEIKHGSFNGLSPFEYLLDLFTKEKIEEDFKTWFRNR